MSKHTNATGPDAVTYKNGWVYLFDNKESMYRTTVSTVKGFTDDGLHLDWIRQARQQIRRSNWPGSIKMKALTAIEEGRINNVVSTSSSSIAKIGAKLGNCGVKFMKINGFSMMVFPPITSALNVAATAKEIESIRNGALGSRYQGYLTTIEYYIGKLDFGTIYYLYSMSMVNGLNTRSGKALVEEIFGYFYSKGLTI